MHALFDGVLYACLISLGRFWERRWPSELPYRWKCPQCDRTTMKASHRDVLDRLVKNHNSTFHVKGRQ